MREPEAAQTPRAEGNTSFATVVCFAVWLALVAAAMLGIAKYTNSPGPLAQVPQLWPMRSAIVRDATHPTLVMFAHPHCPCTQASLRELDILMAECQGKIAAHVVFLRPEGTSESWVRSDLWHQASAMPGVSVHCDQEGAESTFFGAQTSGQTVLYSPGGQLLFQGGMTIARGHSGDNPGRKAVAEIANARPAHVSRTPVFGCPLFEKECDPRSKGKP